MVQHYSRTLPAAVEQVCQRGKRLALYRKSRRAGIRRRLEGSRGRRTRRVRRFPRRTVTSTTEPEYNMGRRHSGCEHLRSDHVWNSGRNRLRGDACCADLGLDKMDTPTKTANCPVDFVLDRIRFCNSFRRRGRFVSCVCSSSPLSVLRSIASQNISVGSFACSRRNPFWHRWRVATGSVALARAYLWAGNVRILVPRGIR
jgi:hypothetical protein